MATSGAAAVKFVYDVAEMLRYAGSNDGGVDSDYEKVNVDVVRVRFLVAEVEAHGPALAAGRAAIACKLCAIGGAGSTLVRKLQLGNVIPLGNTRCEDPLARARPVAYVDGVLSHGVLNDIVHFYMTRNPIGNKYIGITRTVLDSVDPVLQVEQMAGRAVNARQERRANAKQDAREKLLKKFATPERIYVRLPHGQVPGTLYGTRGGAPNRCLESMPPAHCAVSCKHLCSTGLGSLNGFSCDTGAPRRPPPLESEQPDWSKGACARIRAHQASSLRRVRPLF